MSTTVTGEARPTAARLRIGDFRVDSTRNELARDGVAVRLEPKVVEVLVHLARHGGEVVSREDLLASVWPGVVVGDDALTQAIIKLRRALGDDAHEPTYIETISKRGYRLIAPVEPGTAFTPTASPAPDDAHAERRPRVPRVAKIGVAAMLALGLAVAMVAILGRSVGMPWPIAADTRGALAASIPVVVVLPLANLSGDAKRDYFSDGMTEDIISALGRFSGLRVLSRNAVEPLRGQGPMPASALNRLGARYVVKGSVREGEGRLRVAVELSDAQKGIVLWSERYDGDGAAVFDIQDRIVRHLATALAVRLSGIERERAAARPVETLEAYDLVLRARALIYRMTREGNREARALLARAIELAPNYGEAYVTLAHAEYRRADQGWMPDPREGMRRVEEHARRALTLEDTGTHARAHAQLARVHTHAGNMEQALAEATRAVELNPSDPVAQYGLGSVLVWLGRLGEAIALLESVSRFDPTLDDIMLPLAYYMQEDYAEAVRKADQRIARNPDTVFLHAVRAAALGQLGREAEAKQAVAQVKRLSPFARADLFTPFGDSRQSALFLDGLRKAGL